MSTKTKKQLAQEANEAALAQAPAANLPAIQMQSALPPEGAFDVTKYTTKVINVRARAMQNGEQLIVKALSEIVEGKPMKDDGKIVKKPVELFDALNLQTGELFRLIAGSVLAGILKTECSGPITGRMFALERFEPRNGKLYATYNVRELIENK
jgi:hypothetical protein